MRVFVWFDLIRFFFFFLFLRNVEVHDYVRMNSDVSFLIFWHVPGESQGDGGDESETGLCWVGWGGIVRFDGEKEGLRERRGRGMNEARIRPV